MARLLIIDDEKSLCQVLEIAFRKKGHLVETVSTGQAAKKKIESQVYDLIISDIRMPDLSGIELLEYARETRNPAPFILITAVPTVSTAITALNLGAYRYVVKTDTLVEELSLTVDRALSICRPKHRWAQPAYRIDSGNGPHRGPNHQHGVDYRRKRNREGTRRPRHSRGKPPSRTTVRLHQLRGVSGDAP